ncbi:MAG: hypothetical protein JSW01_04920 [Candidatus Bathyarchaeota archaeon]|nr:MAG: hypothetical protein JSW01_04920 [Candidatus Bathyarchaeota archaeon]
MNILLAIPLSYLFLDYFREKIGEEEVMRQGFSSTEGYWHITPKNEEDQIVFFLSVDGSGSQIQPEEARLTYRIARRTSNSDLRRLTHILGNIILRRSGFKRNNWTILPTPRSKVYLMCKGDYESNHFISDRDVSWILSNSKNEPEHILKQLEGIRNRISFLKEETRYLQNIFYAGNHAIIQVKDTTIQVDLHNGRVYRTNRYDEWGEDREKYVCLVPAVKEKIDVGRILLKTGQSELQLSAMEWDDAVILSKILNIAREESNIINLIFRRNISQLSN